MIDTFAITVLASLFILTDVALYVALQDARNLPKEFRPTKQEYFKNFLGFSLIYLGLFAVLSAVMLPWAFL